MKLSHISQNTSGGRGSFLAGVDDFLSYSQVDFLGNGSDLDLRRLDSPKDIFLSIVVPVFNETGTLEEIIRRIQAVPFYKELIVVDDGSTDGSSEVLRRLAGSTDIRVFFLPTNGGKGRALQYGFLQARGDIIIIQDADLEYDPGDYVTLVHAMIKNNADVVYGSRFSNAEPRIVSSFWGTVGSIVIGFLFGQKLNMPRILSWHSLINCSLTAMSNVFTNLNLTDMETCYKAFRRHVIQSIVPHLREPRFGIEPEITARLARAGYRFCEVSIRYERRTYEQGKKIGFFDGLRAVWCILRYWVAS